MKLITAAMAPLLITAYQHSAATGESATTILAKFFTPWANCTWWITEGLPVSLGDIEITAPERVLEGVDMDAYDWHLHGFADIGDRHNAEMGYVMLSNLQSLKHFSGLKVERDTGHHQTHINEVLTEYGRETWAH